MLNPLVGCAIVFAHPIRSQFSGAATCAECLLQLSKSLPWKSVVTLTLGQCLQTRPQDMDSTSIFGLLVISGFPRVCDESILVLMHKPRILCPFVHVWLRVYMYVCV